MAPKRRIISNETDGWNYTSGGRWCYQENEGQLYTEWDTTYYDMWWGPIHWAQVPVVWFLVDISWRDGYVHEAWDWDWVHGSNKRRRRGF